MVTLWPPTSEAGARFLAWPQVGKLVVTVSRHFTVQKLDQLYVWFPLPFQLPVVI